ncbi:MAG: methanogenesis marker 3 protein, partial [Methanothrix sp.]|nr:methanogenesis marker 3 protein [Methanothrix sp.]
MRVFLDSRQIELPADSKLADALKECGVVPAPGAIVGVVKGRGEMSRQTNSYWLLTTKGKLRIELLDNDLQKIWHESVDKISGSTVRWASADGVAFGPFLSKISFSQEAQE